MTPDGAASGTPATPVVWIASASGVATPGADARGALERWARRKGIVLSAPADARGPVRAIPWGAADEVERALAMAREALVALEPDAADRALAQAEAAVRAAPDLPHAAWLMAEVQRGWAARFARIEPRDPERAARAWQRAAALDGGRVAGVGEVAFDGREAVANVTLEIDGGAAHEVRVDGVAESSLSVARTTGEHHVAVTHDGALAWAGWLTFAPGAVLRVALPAAPACSSGDLAHAAMPAAAPSVTAARVQCPRWFAATTDRDPTRVRIASCAGDRCGPLVALDGDANGNVEGAGAGDPSAASKGWPGWLPWTLAGVGVAAVATTATVLVATGAFRTPPAETRFVGGGVRVNAFPIAF